LLLGCRSIDFVADNSGLTLFHKREQLHLDIGFESLRLRLIFRKWSGVIAQATLSTTMLAATSAHGDDIFGAS
jgi:hypothetical protein